MKNCSKSKNYIVIGAGGTGGHIFPALAFAQYIVKQGEQLKWYGSKRGLEQKIASQYQLDYCALSVKGFRGKSFFKSLFGLFSIIFSSILCCWDFIKQRPKAVIGFGGYASAPVCIAAILLNIDLYIQEQNSIPGGANKFFARFAKKVFLGFAEAERYFNSGTYCIYSGNPLRMDMYRKCKSREDISCNELSILVVGGSLGAQILNEVVPAAVHHFLKDGIKLKIIHQCSKLDVSCVKRRYENVRLALLKQFTTISLDVEVTSFIQNMSDAYFKSDFVVARAGALTISEIIQVCVPSILIPFPYATDNHQLYNALYLSDRSAAITIKQHDFNEWLLAEYMSDYMAKDRLSLVEKIDNLELLRLQVLPVETIYSEMSS